MTDRTAAGREAGLAVEFTRIRPRLVGVAYSLVGTVAEAQDVVSDCWLRLVAADARETVRDVEGWAVVAVARRALDVLRSARVRREEYVGPWLPEPLVPASSDDPADRVTLDDRVSFALMVVLETLTPAERTTWVLHEVFGMPFPEIAAVVGRSAAAVRQLAVRARAHVAAGAPRVDVGTAEHRRVVDAFLRAVGRGDLPGLLAVLDPDVVLTSDGGGLLGVARRPVLGADRVARFLVGVRRKMSADERIAPLTVTGGPGFAVVIGASGARFVGSVTLHDGRVGRVDLVVAPDKLPRDLDVQVGLGVVSARNARRTSSSRSMSRRASPGRHAGQRRHRHLPPQPGAVALRRRRRLRALLHGRRLDWRKLLGIATVIVGVVWLKLADRVPPKEVHEQ